MLHCLSKIPTFVQNPCCTNLRRIFIQKPIDICINIPIVFQVLFSPLVTADPRKWPRRALGSALTMTRGLLRLPLRIRDEIRALKELKRTGQVVYPNTLTWKYAGLGQLSARAAGEAWRTALEVYKAPATLWTDTIGADDGQRHQLQTVNLCGRKVCYCQQLFFYSRCLPNIILPNNVIYGLIYFSTVTFVPAMAFIHAL